MGIFFDELVNSCSCSANERRDMLNCERNPIQQEEGDMPNTFNFLVCMLALLVGILIGEKYRKWKKGREEKEDIRKGAEIKRTDGSVSSKKDSDAEPPV